MELSARKAWGAFIAVTGMERNLALSIWYSVTNDHFQREMLKAAVSATNSERSTNLPKAPDDLKWLLDRAEEVADARNNAVHAPCSLYLGGSVSEMEASYFNRNPAPRDLWGKELLVEFAWCERRPANAISTKILERVIEMSTLPGDLVLDPFGGSGTTYSVCERRHRHWIGIEIENPQPIIERLKGKIDHHRNDDFVEQLPTAAE